MNETDLMLEQKICKEIPLAKKFTDDPTSLYGCVKKIAGVLHLPEHMITIGAAPDTESKDGPKRIQINFSILVGRVIDGDMIERLNILRKDLQKTEGIRIIEKDHEHMVIWISKYFEKITP